MSKRKAHASGSGFKRPAFDLAGRARLEMTQAGFLTSSGAAVNSELKALTSQEFANQSDVLDLRSLLWSSIDNPDSRDLDQVEFAEQLEDGKTRVLIGIADVDRFAPRNSAIDRHAFQNTTSVYTGITTFPMLPEELSNNLSSLIEGKDRFAFVIDITMDSGASVVASCVYPARVNNHAKLDYDMVGSWLDRGGQAPSKLASVRSLPEQIQFQNAIRTGLHDLRVKHGTLILQTTEATAITLNGEVVDLVTIESNPARDLIENFMIAGNIAISQFLESKGFPSIRRVVKTPERWPKIVELAASYGFELPASADSGALAKFLRQRRTADAVHFGDLSLTIVKLLGRGEYIVEIPGQTDLGHFALAVHEYTHATAPNRRYADLVTQRLIKAATAGQPSPYSLDELTDIARQCTLAENNAKKVERTMRKIAAAVFLSKHIGETFKGIVTGVKPEGTYVRLLRPAAEGRITQGEGGLDVGDKVNVRLLSTDPEHAFIDFARVK